MKAKRQLSDLLKIEHFDAVHCNTPIGGLLGRIYGYKAKIPYIIYQAHGFHFWKGAPLKNPNDISRVMIVQNRWVTYGGQLISGVIDHAAFEQVKRQGDAAIKRWIDEQLRGTSATVVLIGSETLNRYYVQYEICQSIKQKNAIIGVNVNNIRDFSGRTCLACNPHTAIGTFSDGTPVYFDKIAYQIYDYQINDGYNNLHRWVEDAVQRR